MFRAIFDDKNRDIIEVIEWDLIMHYIW
jgi:hypothetical protein